MNMKFPLCNLFQKVASKDTENTSFWNKIIYTTILSSLITGATILFPTVAKADLTNVTLGWDTSNRIDAKGHLFNGWDPYNLPSIYAYNTGSSGQSVTKTHQITVETGQRYYATVKETYPDGTTGQSNTLTYIFVDDAAVISDNGTQNDDFSWV